MKDNGGPSRRSTRPDVNQRAALVDVQLLDLLAEVEALLRKAREVQREILRVRGEPQATTDGQRLSAAAKIAKIADAMWNDYRVVGTMVRVLRRRADQLHRSVRQLRPARD